MEYTFLSTVDELSSVHSLNCQEVFFPGLEPVRVTEVNYSKGRSTTRVMDDVLKIENIIVLVKVL